MTDLPEISDEMARAFNRAFNEAYDRLGDDEPYEATRAGLAAALVASSYRREADVRAEVAEEIARAIEAVTGEGGIHGSAYDHAAWIARFHRVPDCGAQYHGADGGPCPGCGFEPVGALPVADGREVDVRITPAVSRTVAAPVTFHEVDEPVADVQAAFEAGEKGVTKPPAGAPQCTCPLIDTSAPGGPPSFSLGDPAGCKVHGQARDAEIEAAKRRARG